MEKNGINKLFLKQVTLHLRNRVILRKLVDINCYAINLVEDHPGYTYVEPVISEGLLGNFKLVVLDVVPFRVHWIMTKRWEFNKEEARQVILDFLKGNPNIEYFGLDQKSIVKAFKLAETLNHDIYDCYYLVGALSSNCQAILTTDSDFEKLCQRIRPLELKLIYENPVPKQILTEFAKFKS